MATRGRPRRVPEDCLSFANEVDDRPLKDHPRADRENANKLAGLALRELGRRHGIPMSSMDRMDDAKLRRQISIAQENATQEQAMA